MATRKNTKFNKNNGYKDFTFSKNTMKNNDYSKMIDPKNNNVDKDILVSSVKIPTEIDQL